MLFSKDISTRSRDREKAGKSEHSWIKHGMLDKIATSQIAAFRFKFPDRSAMLIDGNAGDGEGVDKNQRDFFKGEIQSKPTAELLCDLADTFGADVCLCERKQYKREKLSRLFPNRMILEDHARAPSLIVHDYTLWVSDPNGPKDHGVEHMAAVARRVQFSDFVIVLNEGALGRIGSTEDALWQVSRERYLWMLEPAEWLQRIPKKFLARTPVIRQSSNFHYRLMVISNYLTDAVHRLRHVEIIAREK
jgi:hypothetical protein